jgi:hypothetical protein
MNLPRLGGILIFSGALAACSNSTQSLPATGLANGASVSVADGSAASVTAWHNALHQNPLPAAGCYKASYPSQEWQNIACGAPLKQWYPRRTPHLELGQTVGYGHDYTIVTKPHLISQTIGSFPVAKDVKTVTSVNCPTCTGETGVNSYSLQLNSTLFNTKACGTLPECVGWEQFIYTNPTGSNDGQLLIEDWLIMQYTNGFSNCPPGQGWYFIPDGGCVQNSQSVDVPNVPITSLGSIVVTGVAAKSGDSLYMSVGKTEYGMKKIQGDGITDLADGWQGSEFNVLGNAGGDIADFNAGAKISVNIQADDGVKSAPTCPANSGETAETNNLFFIPAPETIAKAQYPSIEFAMSSKRGKKGTCTVAEAK